MRASEQEGVAMLEKNEVVAADIGIVRDDQGSMLVIYVNAVEGVAARGVPLTAKITPGRTRVALKRGLHGTVYIPPLTDEELAVLSHRMMAQIHDVDEAGKAVSYFAELSIGG